MKNNRPAFFCTACLLLSMLLVSCDPGVKHTKTIENGSDYDIAIMVYQPANFAKGNYVSDSIWIGKHSKTEIYKRQHVGQAAQYKDCFTDTDSIRVRIIGHDSLRLHFDLSDNVNWKYRLLDKVSSGDQECDCSIKITNKHIR